jgi:hypothetical protein
MFTQHGSQFQLIALILILIVEILFLLSLHDLRMGLSGLDPLRMTRRRFRLPDKGRPHRKSQRILILFETPYTFADNHPFKHTGHGDQPFDVGQFQTDSQRTDDDGIILGQAEFFSRRLADQRKPIGSDISQQRPEQFHRGTYLHPYPQRDRLSLFCKADESDVPSTFDGSRQFSLVPHTIAGDAARNDPTPLSEKVSQEPDIFKIDRSLINTKPARPSALKKPAAALPISALFTLHHRLPLCLDMFVGFISGIIMRRCLNPTTAILAFRHERDRLGHHFVLAALLAVLCFPSALL